jgi:hypothetical protein
MWKYRFDQATEVKRCADVLLHDHPLRITDVQIIMAAGGVRRINDTIRIVKNGRTQQYMQVWLTFQSR